jgi:hypothetical protein
MLVRYATGGAAAVEAADPGNDPTHNFMQPYLEQSGYIPAPPRPHPAKDHAPKP